MKKLLVGLLVLGSISSYAGNCEIKVAAPNMSLSESVVLDQLDILYDGLSEKGYAVSESENSNYSFIISQTQYQFHEVPRYITPVGVSANFYNEALNKEIFVTKEDLAVVVGREEARLPKITRKAVKKLLRKIPSCI